MRPQRVIHIIRACTLGAIAAAGATMHIDALAQSVSLRHAARLDDATLAEVRGGFVSPQTGLAVSFGIERAVYVNGDPVASSVLSTAGATGVTLVQRGAGNSVDAAILNGLASSRAAGTIVQNSLDNQRIQTVTTIDVKANSLSTWNGMNLNTSVSNAVAASLRR